MFSHIFQPVWQWQHFIHWRATGTQRSGCPSGNKIFEGVVNSLAPGRSSCDFKNVIFNLALLIGIFKSSYDNVLRWMPQDLTVDKSTLVQVMAWCRQATSHYLNQCWPRSPTPYGITRPQWVLYRFPTSYSSKQLLTVKKSMKLLS